MDLTPPLSKSISFTTNTPERCLVWPVPSPTMNSYRSPRNDSFEDALICAGPHPIIEAILIKFVSNLRPNTVVKCVFVRCGYSLPAIDPFPNI
jgi:hypothetical protein